MTVPVRIRIALVDSLSRLMEHIPEIRWNLELACREFGADQRTLRKRLIAADALAGPDGCYSTPQITAAVFGDLYGEKLRIAKEQADKLELANKVRRDELYDADASHRAFEAIFTAVRQKILNSKLANDEKDDLLRDLLNVGEIRIKAQP
jgi:hypothetical protein